MDLQYVLLSAALDMLCPSQSSLSRSMKCSQIRKSYSHWLVSLRHKAITSRDCKTLGFAPVSNSWKTVERCPQRVIIHETLKSKCLHIPMHENN